MRPIGRPCTIVLCCLIFIISQHDDSSVDKPHRHCTEWPRRNIKEENNVPLHQFVAVAYANGSQMLCSHSIWTMFSRRQHWFGTACQTAGIVGYRPLPGVYCLSELRFLKTSTFEPWLSPFELCSALGRSSESPTRRQCLLSPPVSCSTSTGCYRVLQVPRLSVPTFFQVSGRRWAGGRKFAYWKFT